MNVLFWEVIKTLMWKKSDIRNSIFSNVIGVFFKLNKH